jgi:amino acid transporter
VVLSYREVVTVYTAGGSYVVARENVGPRVAQVAAVALMVDYVVTVAVQTAAGSVARSRASSSSMENRLGASAAIVISVQCPTGNFWSRAMLRASTSTCGSPRNPSVRPWMWLATSARTVAGLACLAAATRSTCM